MAILGALWDMECVYETNSEAKAKEWDFMLVVRVAYDETVNFITSTPWGASRLETRMFVNASVHCVWINGSEQDAAICRNGKCGGVTATY